MRISLMHVAMALAIHPLSTSQLYHCNGLMLVMSCTSVNWVMTQWRELLLTEMRYTAQRQTYKAARWGSPSCMWPWHSATLPLSTSHLFSRCKPVVAETSIRRVQVGLWTLTFGSHFPYTRCSIFRANPVQGVIWSNMYKENGFPN